MDTKIPKTVSLSVSLLIATHAVGLWQMVLLSKSLGVALWMPYTALAVVYSVLAVLFVMVVRGRRWARTAYTVIAVFGLISALGHAQDLSEMDFVVAAAKVAAVVLLYLAASERWFSRSSVTPVSVSAAD